MNNKKTTSLLISLFVSLVFLSIIVFILSETGFLVGLNQKWLWLAALWLLPAWVVLAPTKARSVVARLFLSKKSKKFLLLTGANIIFTLLFVVIYAISQYGSPLIYENHPQSFKAVKEIPLIEGTTISQEFKADSNNLGTIGVRLSVQEKTLGYDKEGEIIEIKPEKEIADEETQEEQVVDQADFTEDEREGLEKIAYYEPVEIIFRLKEKGGEDWLYENSYFFDQTAPVHLYPFGFPVIENSKNKTYLVEVEGQKEITPEENNLYVFIPVDNNNGSYFYSRYASSLKNISLDVIGTRTLKILANKSIFRLTAFHFLFCLGILIVGKVINFQRLISFLFSLMIFIGAIIGPLSLLSKYSIPKLLQYYSYFLLFLTGIGQFFLSQKGKKGERFAIAIHPLFKKTVIAVSIIIFLIATLPRLNYEIRGDEWHQFNLSYGFLKTGEFQEWNFIYEKPEFHYAREHPATIIIAGFFGLFGISETVARIPGLVAALIFLYFIYYLFKKVLKRESLSAVMVLYFATNTFFIYQATYLRSYIYLMLTIILLITNLIMVLRIRGRKEFWLRLLLSLILVYLAHKLHPLGISLLSLVAIACFIRGIQTFNHFRNRKHGLFIFGMAIVAISLALGLFVFQKLGKPFISDQLSFSLNNSSLSLLTMNIFFVIFIVAFFICELIFDLKKYKSFDGLLENNKEIVFLLLITISLHLLYDIFIYYQKGMIPRYMIQLLILNPLLFYFIIFHYFQDGLKRISIISLVFIVLINNYALASSFKINTDWSSGYNIIDMYGGPNKSTVPTRDEAYHNIADPKIIAIAKSLPKQENLAIISDLVIENYYLKDLSEMKNRVTLISIRPLDYGFKNIIKGITDKGNTKPRTIESISDIDYYASQYDHLIVMWEFRKGYKVSAQLKEEINNNPLRFAKISGKGIDDSAIETYLVNKNENKQ